MNILTIIWSMAAAAALTMGGIQLAVWLWDRKAWASLFFFFAACATAATSVVEMAMANAETSEQYASVMTWSMVPLWILVVSLIYFVRFLFGAGRMWIAYLSLAIWTLTMVVNFLPGVVGVSGIRHGYLFGQSVYHVAEGSLSFWSLLNDAGTLAAILYVADASVSVWRKGERRRALVVGGSIIIFFLLASSQSILIEAGLLEIPYMVSLAFLFIVTALGLELSYGLLNAARVSRELKKSEAELRESEERLSMAAESAGVGLWNLDLRTGDYWITDRAREIYGIAPDENATPELFNSRVHAEDRERVLTMGKLTRPGEDGAIEFRMVHPNGRMRWVSSHGRIHHDESGRPSRLTGVSIDITERKGFEQKLYELSGRLLNLQDEERRTIARNLHDQTAQNLALLNINLSLLQKLIPQGKKDIDHLVDQSFQLIKQSLQEVRTLSYLLHPPMLDEAGLIAALRWYIGGFSKRSGIEVTFEPDELCEKLPGEIEDTLYRVVQESLSNIHLHSGSKTADVELHCEGSRVVLRIADRGRGFPAPVDISRKDDYRFLGMGLMGMRQRVCQHGGDLSIESDETGTRITAQLPLRGAV